MHYYLKAKNLFIGNTTTAVAGILEIKEGRIVHHLDYNASVEALSKSSFVGRIC